MLRPDYNQHFLATSNRPQNFIVDASLDNRFSGYPKLQALTSEMTELVAGAAHPALGLCADLGVSPIEYLGYQFDSILIDPPWEEYALRSLTPQIFWSWEEISRLRVDLIAGYPSFCFLWCGSRHVEEGMACLAQWGFKRVEDICWLKTNRSRVGPPEPRLSPDEVLHSTVEHCLVGLRGSGLRRSADTHAVMANVDCDVILAEQPADLCDTAKPDEIYEIIERLSLGTRRLELFGRRLRDGWVTVGNEIVENNFSIELLSHYYANIPRFVPTTAGVEAQRPRTPPKTR